MLTGTVEFILFTVGILLAFEYFYAANEIFRFSNKGILPSEDSKRRNKRYLLIIWAASYLTGMVYLLATAVTTFEE